MLKIWHYLNYIGHFLLVRPAENECILDNYGSFWTFQEVLHSCNILQLAIERCGSVSILSVDMFLLLLVL